MNSALIPVLVVFIVVGIPVICGTLISLAKTLRDNPSNKGGSSLTEEEGRLLHDINRGLARMEERVEALETIIIERERRSKK